MKNPLLEKTILNNLNNVDYGMMQKTLQSAVEIDLDSYDITTGEFMTCLKALEDRALVNQWTSLLGYTYWGITDMGRDALKGL